MTELSGIKCIEKLSLAYIILHKLIINKIW